MKKLTGKIISDKMTNTVVVNVSRFLVHPLYQKRFLRHKKYHAHNALEAKIGDQVEMVEARPMSKTIRWNVTKVIKEGAAREA